MAILGLLIGLMIGRLANPDPAHLENIEVLPGSIVLWFNDEPQLHSKRVEGTVAVLFDATGAPANGRLLVDGKPATWRIVRNDEGLLLTVLAARALRADVLGGEQDGRWRLVVSLAEQ